MNVELGLSRAIPFLGLFVSNSRYWFFAVRGGPCWLFKLRQVGPQGVHMKGVLSWLVRWARRTCARDLCPALAASVWPKIFFSSPYTITVHLSHKVHTYLKYQSVKSPRRNYVDEGKFDLFATTTVFSEKYIWISDSSRIQPWDNKIFE